MILLLGKAAGERLPPKHRSGQELCHRAAAFPRNNAAVRSSPALGLVTSPASLGNAGKHQKMRAGKDTDTNRMVTRHRKYWAVSMWPTLGKPLCAVSFILEFLLPSMVQQAAQGLPLLLGSQWGRGTEAPHLDKLDHFWSGAVSPGLQVRPTCPLVLDIMAFCIHPFDLTLTDPSFLFFFFFKVCLFFSLLQHHKSSKVLLAPFWGPRRVETCWVMDTENHAGL